MSKPVTCRKCPQTFSGPEAHSAMSAHYYQNHLRTAADPATQFAAAVKRAITRRRTAQRPRVALLASPDYRGPQEPGRHVIDALPVNAKTLSSCETHYERHLHWYAHNQRSLPALKLGGKSSPTEAAEQAVLTAHIVVIFHTNDPRSRHLARLAHANGKPLFTAGPDGQPDREFYRQTRQNTLQRQNSRKC